MLIDGIKNKDGNINREGLFKILKSCRDELDQGAEPDVNMKGKSLELANRENSSLQHYYECRRIELNSILKWLDVIIDKHRAKVFQYLTEKNPRDLSDRAKEKYIDTNEGYMDLCELRIATLEVHDMYQSVVDAFRSRGFQLRNITELRVNQIQGDII